MKKIKIKKSPGIEVGISIWDSEKGMEVDFRFNTAPEVEPVRTKVLIALAALGEKLLGEEKCGQA